MSECSDDLAAVDGNHELQAMADLAHRHAQRVESVLEELAVLRWQQAHDPEIVLLREQYAAVSAEIDRLRALPELRVAQRLRNLTPRRADTEREDGGVLVRERTVPTATTGASTTGPIGLPYPPVTPPAAVVTIRNRPKSVRLVLDCLAQLGVSQISIVDNASADPQLLTNLKSMACEVAYMPQDLGVHAAWASGVLARELHRGNVLEVGGGRLPGPQCPADVLERMTHELDRRPDVDAIVLTGSGSSADTGVFRLLRAGLTERPRITATLGLPYASGVGSTDPTDPSERFAHLHDTRALDADDN